MPVPSRAVRAYTVLIIGLFAVIGLQSRSIANARSLPLEPMHADQSYPSNHYNKRSSSQNSSHVLEYSPLARRTTAKEFTDNEYQSFRVYGFSQAERLWDDPNAGPSRIDTDDFQYGWVRTVQQNVLSGIHFLDGFIGLEGQNGGLLRQSSITPSKDNWKRTLLNQNIPYEVAGQPRQQPTNAALEMTLSKKFDAIIFHRVSTPWFSLDANNPERNVKVPPPVNKFKDLVSYEWNYRAKGSSARFFLYLEVGQTDETLGIINKIISLPDGYRSLHPYQAVTLPIGSAGYYGLMGTQAGLNTIDYLLANTFGSKKYTVASVTIVNLEQNGYPSLFFSTISVGPEMHAMAEENKRFAGQPGDWRFPHPLAPVFAKHAPGPWINIHPAVGQHGSGQSSSFANPAGGSSQASSSQHTSGQPGSSSQQANDNQPGSATHRLDGPPPRIDAAADSGRAGSQHPGANPRPVRPGKEPATDGDFIRRRYQVMRPSVSDLTARRRIALEYMDMHPGVSEAEALNHVNRALGDGSRPGR